MEKTQISRLATVVERCIERNDSQFPLFHGCVDWHSAVHGHWALLWSAHRLRDPQLRDRILARFEESRITAEWRALRRRDVAGDAWEMPYGRAWFLQLARDAESLHGFPGLRALGDYLFNTLLEFARNGGGDTASSTYDNAGWMFHQMVQWACFTGDTNTASEIRQMAARRFRDQPGWRTAADNTGFFDPRAMAALALQKHDSFRKLSIADYLQPPLPEVVRFPVARAHLGGLNYSRSWGYWILAAETGDRRYGQAADHLLAYMDESLPTWGGDYQKFGHWVAQFGLFADRIRIGYCPDY